jgi:hypothetical protein
MEYLTTQVFEKDEFLLEYVGAVMNADDRPEESNDEYAFFYRKGKKVYW